MWWLGQRWWSSAGGMLLVMLFMCCTCKNAEMRNLRKMQKCKTILMGEMNAVSEPQMAVLIRSYFGYYLCVANAKVQKCKNAKPY